MVNYTIHFALCLTCGNDQYRVAAVIMNLLSQTLTSVSCNLLGNVFKEPLENILLPALPPTDAFLKGYFCKERDF